MRYAYQFTTFEGRQSVALRRLGPTRSRMMVVPIDLFYRFAERLYGRATFEAGVF